MMDKYQKRFLSFVDDVLDNQDKYPTGVVQAVERHVADLERPEFRLDWSLVTRFCNCAENLPHVQGRLSQAKTFQERLIKLEPWQVFGLGSMFGWVNVDDGLRRFNRAIWFLPRKNGKSLIASCVGNYMLVADGEGGPEVICLAATAQQARKVFDVARDQLRSIPANQLKALRLEPREHSILSHRNRGVFRFGAGQSKLDGMNTHCGILDEIHEHTGPETHDSLVSGIAGRDQPMVFIISTAGFDMGGIGYQVCEQAREILRQERTEDSTFALLYEADPTDDEGENWKKEETWYKMNPNLGIAINPKAFKAEFEAAVGKPQAEQAWKTKHLNIWSNVASPWLESGLWESAVGTEEPTDDDWKLVVGVDLAVTRDLTSIAMVWVKSKDFSEREGYEDPDTGIVEYIPSDNMYIVKTISFTTDVVVEENRALYGRFVKADNLRICPGNSIDYEEVIRELVDIARRHQVSGMAFDARNAEPIVRAMEANGIECAKVQQGAMLLSPAMNEVHAALKNNRLRHPKDICMDWQIGNVEVKPDIRGMIYPRKAREEAKIDAPMALFTAISAIITDVFDLGDDGDYGFIDTTRHD